MNVSIFREFSPTCRVDANHIPMFFGHWLLRRMRESIPRIQHNNPSPPSQLVKYIVLLGICTYIADHSICIIGVCEWTTQVSDHRKLCILTMTSSNQGRIIYSYIPVKEAALYHHTTIYNHRGCMRQTIIIHTQRTQRRGFFLVIPT